MNRSTKNMVNARNDYRVGLKNRKDIVTGAPGRALRTGCSVTSDGHERANTVGLRLCEAPGARERRGVARAGGGGQGALAPDGHGASVAGAGKVWGGNGDDARATKWKRVMPLGRTLNVTGTVTFVVRMLP